MINATTNDPTAQNQASDEPTKVGIDSMTAPTSTEISPNPSASANEKPNSSKKKKKFNVKMIAGVFALLLIIVGAGAGLFLSQQSQDIRQQADDTPTDDPYYAAPTTIVETIQQCSTGTIVNGVCTSSKPDCEDGTWSSISQTCGTPGDTVPVVGNQNEICTKGDGIQTCYSLADLNLTSTGNLINQVTGLLPGNTPLIIDPDHPVGALYGTTTPATIDQFNNEPDTQVSGFYWYPPGEEYPQGQRYVIDVPSTNNYATKLASGNLSAFEQLNIGDPRGGQVTAEGKRAPGDSLDLRPFLVFGKSPAYNVVAVNGAGHYITLDSQGRIIVVTGLYDATNGKFFLDSAGLETMIGDGQTWVSSATGCNDGVHDGTTADPTTNEYPGDCNAWHFTTCLDEGSGVNGWGCGSTRTGETTTTTTTTTLTCNSTCTTNTQCSSLNSGWFCDPASSRCRLQANPPSTSCEPAVIPGEPMCKDVAILKDGVEIDPVTTPINIGTVLQFRCASDDPDNQVIKYEFQIIEPDGNVVEGSAINPAGTSATSLEYQIDQYLEYKAQCRVCTSAGCQAYQSITQ